MKSLKFQSNPFSAAWIHTISGRKVELSSNAFRTIPLAAVNEMKFNWISKKKYLLKALKGSNYRISSYLCFSLGENRDSRSPLTVKMTAVLHAQTSARHFLPLLMKGGTADIAWERCLKNLTWLFISGTAQPIKQKWLSCNTVSWGTLCPWQGKPGL